MAIAHIDMTRMETSVMDGAGGLFGELRSHEQKGFFIVLVRLKSQVASTYTGAQPGFTNNP